MTILVWDGFTLVADKRSSCAGKSTTVTKIFKTERHNPGTLLGITGDLSKGMEMVEWFEQGAVPDKVPGFQRTGDNITMIEVRGDRSLWVYEGPVPFKVEDPYWATGSGRDYALAALHLGKNAVEAVAVASHFDQNCGNGVDVMNVPLMSQGGLNSAKFTIDGSGYISVGVVNSIQGEIVGIAPTAPSTGTQRPAPGSTEWSSPPPVNHPVIDGVHAPGGVNPDDPKYAHRFPLKT